MDHYSDNGKDANGMPTDLHSTWGQFQQDKGDREKRSEQYAMWTIPAICPVNGEGSVSQSKGNVAIGARLVNHLANRIVDVMFPSDRPFFSLPLNNKAKQRFRDNAEDEDSAAKALAEVQRTTERIVDDAMRELDLTKYRPVAVEVIKHSIVTGGCMLRRFADNMRAVYGVKDYCVVRDSRGVMICVILRDCKKFKTLTRKQQEFIAQYKPGHYKEDTDIQIFTYFERKDAEHWHGIQALDQYNIPSSYDTYTNETLPVIDITWSLSRGENYPRGLVEDNSVLFHNIDVTTEAILDLIGIAANVKYLVNPGSGIDVVELNNSPRGSYHAGADGDISAIEFKHRLDLAIMSEQVQQWEQLLSQAFLLNSGSIRQAERVTAEEVRLYARELESAFGGLYSKLALSWQKREAEYLLQQLNIGEYASLLRNFDVTITTGLESLSREGQLDALRLAIADLGMLDAVPEDIRQVLDKQQFATFVFTNRGISFGQFVLSPDQVAANQQQQEQQQVRMMQEQEKARTAGAVASQSAKGE